MRSRHSTSARWSPGSQPGDVEKHFRVKLGDVVVTGSIDRIDEGPDGVVLIDYKTSEIDDQDQADEEANDSLQLLVYALAYQEMTGTHARPNGIALRADGDVGATTRERGAPREDAGADPIHRRFDPRRRIRSASKRAHLLHLRLPPDLQGVRRI